MNAKYACAYPNCPETIREGRYCLEHKTKASREYDKQHRSKHSRLYGSQWRKLRQLYVSTPPLCEKCLEQGFHVPVAEVHHILPLDEGGTHAEDNLVSLCQSCHTKTRSSPVYR
jgi:5-methylcytosine-specific restriction protein A